MEKNKADSREEPEYPEVSFPIPHSVRVNHLLDIVPSFTDEELKNDERLADIIK